MNEGSQIGKNFLCFLWDNLHLKVIDNHRKQIIILPYFFIKHSPYTIMNKARSKSAVDTITSLFNQKFKDKINFINKQGNVCHMFEAKTPNVVLTRPKTPKKSSKQKQNTYHQYKSPCTDDERNRSFSLPKLNTASSTSSVNSNKTRKAEKAKPDLLNLGLSHAPRPKLQLCR